MPKRGKVIRFPKSPPVPDRAARDVAAHEQIQRADERWSEIRRCRDQAEALVVKSLIESDGIPCLLRSHLVHSVHPFTVGDQGEVVVMVPSAEADRARLLLARIPPGPSFP